MDSSNSGRSILSNDSDTSGSNTVLLVLATLLLGVCFLFGGDSAHPSLGMAAAQLLAIPVLIIAVVRSARRGRIQSARWGVLVVLMIGLLPLLQLLPLPAWIWTLPAERQSLLQDLSAAGVATVAQRWTLSPGASERDFLFMLPGLALFFSMLAVGRAEWRRMLGLIIGLSVVNLILAAFQIAAGQQSFLNLYPDFAPTLGGVFANKNHQADLLAIGLMLALVLMSDAWRRAQEGYQSHALTGLLAILALTLLAALPVIGSRAGVIVAMVMLMAVFLTSALPALSTFRRSRWLQVLSVLLLLVFAAGLQAALGWIKRDNVIEGSRYLMTTETLRIGAGHAPLGAGAGAFEAAFEQGATDSMLTYHYINNAHDDYAQWWLEAGVAGVLATLLALVVLARTLVALLGQRQQSRTRVCGMAAMMGIGVIVLHSTVDYPLRTPALAAVLAALSGIAIAAASNRPSVRLPSRLANTDSLHHSRTPRSNRP
jgi:O-antigen ligase